MGRSYFLIFLLISAALALCFPQGSGRKVTKFESEAFNLYKENAKLQKFGKERRMAESLTDYNDPGANTNPRSGDYYPPPSN